MGAPVLPVGQTQESFPELVLIFLSRLCSARLDRRADPRLCVLHSSHRTFADKYRTFKTPTVDKPLLRRGGIGGQRDRGYENEISPNHPRLQGTNRWVPKQRGLNIASTPTPIGRSVPYKVLSHTADTGIEATAPSISTLIDELATGMFDLMATEAPCPPDVGVEVEVEVVAPTLEDLVVELLSELLYESEVQDLVLCEFETTMLGPTHARINARGVDISGVEVTGPPIKAVTYHAVVVDRRGENWLGRVYFDV